MRVLVTGATGNVGAPVVQALTNLGIDVVAAIRPGHERLRDVGTVELDFAEPATWDAALDGVDRLFLLRPPAISDVQPTLNAFVDRGADRLRRVVFLSVAGAEKNSVIPHARVERHLTQGQVPWTLLRAGFFGQNLCGPYRDDIREDDRLYVPAGHQGVSWVDTRDLADAAAKALVDGTDECQAWTLTGRETRTFAEVAAVLSRHLGRPIRYEPASLPGYLCHLRRTRELPWGPAFVFTVLHTAIRLGAESRVDPTLERVLGRAPRTIDATIRDNLQLWVR